MRKTKTRLLSGVVAVAVLATSVPWGTVPALGAPAEKEVKPLKLQYTAPADGGKDERDNWKRWALPLGNGHMGAMVFGRTGTERIQMNEKTLWSGGTGGADNEPDGSYATKDPLSDAYGNVDAAGSGAMDKYINYLFDQLYNGATSSNGPAESGEMKILPNNRDALGDYQNFAEMYMDYNHEIVTDYSRELDLRTATSAVSYTCEDTVYTREMFANYPSNVMVYRVSSDKKGGVDLTLRPEIPDLGTTSGPRNKTLTKTGTVVADETAKTITMDGQIVNNGMKFAGKFLVENVGGTVTADNAEASGAKGKLTITGADSVVIYVTLATNYKNVFPDYRQEDEDYAMKNVVQRLEAAAKKGYEKLYEEHLADYQELFSRVELDLGGTYDPAVTTDQLLNDWKTASASGTQNHYLEELYYQYGRYMTITASRSDTLPSNLQGVWNDRAFPDWQSDYHTNINLQMNYWPVFVTDLAEIGESLIDYIDSLREPGTLTATKLFGTEDVWMVNCSANALGFTGNINSNASMASTASAFILQNVYDYYQYTGDKGILEKQIYPIMKNACEFFLKVLQKGRTDSDADKLFMAPSFSSEHGPWTIGAYFDQQLIYLLFADTLEAAGELGLDDAFTEQLEETMVRLYPLAIGESGQVKEWQQEGAYNRYKSSPSTKIGDDAHRHNSQLMMLHPGNQITTETPEWMDAARKTLTLRGDGATGWSMGQKLNMWARLQDGNHAYTLFKNLMKNGTFTNLFDFHTPDIFQIDGNYGATAGISEMLMQSHAGYVSILPALPDDWASGSVKGLIAEGNFQVDLAWADKKVTELAITSRNGGPLSVKCGVIGSIVDTATGETVTDTTQEANGAVSFATVKGHTYKIQPGRAQSLLPIEKYVTKLENSGIVPYAYTTETGDAYEEALMACKRMAEQKNYVAADVDKTVKRLEEAVAALVRREGKEYAAAMALQFLANAAEVNYQGAETEDVWRQSVEYDRADLIEALRAGSQDGAELLAEPERLSETGNQIAAYPAARNNLFGLIGEAVSVSMEGLSLEEQKAYWAGLDEAVEIYVDVNAAEQDLVAAQERLKKALENTEAVYTITAETEGPGSITPSGAITVLDGADKTFTMKPEDGAEILDVLVDGRSVGPVSSYRVERVEKDLTIQAVFQKAQQQASEEEILLNKAILRASALNAEDYQKEGWQTLTEALEAAKGLSREAASEMRAKAEALLDAMDALVCWGEAERTEAENSLYPVKDFSNQAVYSDSANWGDKPLNIEEANPLGGYPEGGPVKAGGTGADGQWVVQSVTDKTPASNGKQMLVKTPGAWVKFGFTGSRVRYITEMARDGAGVDAYIDGTKVAELDCFTNNQNENYRNYVLFDSEDYDLDLSEGSHELKLVMYLDDKNTANVNTFPLFRVDAFDAYPNSAQVTATKALAMQVAKLSAMSSFGKTAESWAALQEKLQEAEEVLAQTGPAGADESAVQAAAAALTEAEKGLVTEELTITAITPLMSVKAALGATTEQIKEKLPASVTVKVQDGRGYRVGVSWDLSGLSGTMAADITLKGDLILEQGSGLVNKDNLRPEITVAVAKKEAVITLGNLKQTEGAVTPVTAVTDPAGLTVQIRYDGAEALPTAPGRYRVEAQVVDEGYTGTAKGTLVIAELVTDPVEEAQKAQQAAEEAKKLAEEKAAAAEAAKKLAEEKAAAAEKARKESAADAAELKAAWEKAKAEAEKAAKAAEEARALAVRLAESAIGRPEVKLTNAAYNKIKLTWNRQEGTDGYEISRSTSKNTGYKVVKTVAGGSQIKYTDGKLSCGKTYYYKIRAYKDSSLGRLYGTESKIVKLKAAPDQAVIAKASAGKGSATIKVKKQSGVNGYEVRRSQKMKSGYKKVKAGKSLTVKDTKLSSKKTYYYKVRAYKTVKGKKVYGAYSQVKVVKVK